MVENGSTSESNPSNDPNSNNSYKNRNWIDLPDDTLRQHIESMNWLDQIRCRSVCKKFVFENEKFKAQTKDNLPWLMNYSWFKTNNGRINNVCKLHNPSTQKSYETGDFVNGDICASSNGWLLFSKKPNNITGRAYRCKMFLYCPFTNEFQNLPDLILDRQSQLKVAFHLEPDSSKNIVFAYETMYRDNRCTNHKAWICFPGDDNWENVGCLYALLPLMSVTYASGFFYCFYGDGFLARFDVEKLEMKYLNGRVEGPPYFQNSPCFLMSYHDVIVLLVGLVDRWGLFKFDFSSRMWIKENNSKGLAIFIGATSVAVPIPEKEGYGSLANKIYYQTKKFFTCESGLEAQGDRFPDGTVAQPYAWIPNEETLLKSFWVHPPLAGLWRKI